MTRELLLEYICPGCMTIGCCNGDKSFNCSDCNLVLNKWLDEYDKQIRADAIDDFANWLVEQGILGNRCISDGKITDYGKVYAKKYKEQLKVGDKGQRMREHNSIEKQKQVAKNTNELLNYLIEIIEQNNKRFSFEWAVGGEHATMEIFDNEKEIGYVVNIEPIQYDETGKAINI